MDAEQQAGHSSLGDYCRPQQHKNVRKSSVTRDGQSISERQIIELEGTDV